MQLSVIHDQINFITNTSGGATGTYTDSDMNVNITRWAHILTAEIIDAMDDWDYQFETATSDLVASQREYIFPTDLLTIKRIELKLDGTNWRVATKFDVNETAYPVASETDITNSFNNDSPYVDIGDRSFFVYSGSITSITGGIKIWYTEEIVGQDDDDDDITDFSSDDDVPNLAEAFQRGLVYGPAKDYFQKFQITDRSAEMDKEIGKIVRKMRTFYNSRNADRKFIVKSSQSMENYE